MAQPPKPHDQHGREAPAARTPQPPYESPRVAPKPEQQHAILAPDAAASLFKNGTRIAKDGEPPEKWISMGRLSDGTPVFQTPMTDAIAEEIKAGSFYVVEDQGHYSSKPLPPSTAPVVNPPVVVDAPYCGGSGTVGESLTCTMGNWENMQDEPHSYAYQWKADGTEISGATVSSYAPTVDDVDKDVHCTVTATNAAGSASSDSNAVAVVAGATRHGRR
jgi:hypothetical protein